MRAFLTRHPFMKLLSLGLAFALWFLVKTEQYTEMSLTVKVQVKNLPDSLIIAGDVDPEIRLRVSGPRTRLKQVAERAVDPVVIDLADAKPGVNAFTLYGEDFKKLPRGVQVTRIVPQVIRITLDPAEERLVKVEPSFTGHPEEGFEVAGYGVDPQYIKVRGGRTELEALAFLNTVPIPLDGRKQSFEGTYALRPHRAQQGLEERSVNVQVTIVERGPSRTGPGGPALRSR